jgi:hypothetical protein
MAILDKKLEFCDALSVVADASATIATSNVINLGTGYNCWGDTKYNDIGEGGDLWLNVAVATTMTPAAVGLTFDLHAASSASAALLNGASDIASWTWKSYAVSAVAGTSLVRAKIPPSPSSLQYLALYITNAATAITAGAIDAWISLDSESGVPRS